MEEVKRFVGIDVAKLALDVFIGSAGVAWSAHWTIRPCFSPRLCCSNEVGT
jgi:hypothetical protein